MSGQSINFGIVGFGNIGKRHAQHILRTGQANLAAVCEIKTDSCDCSIAPDVPCFSSFDNMLATAELDVVNICTPNYLHKPMAIKALEAGKNVVVEKPMALSTADCREMIAAAEAANRQIFVVKQNRYNPPVKEVRKVILQGLLGRVYQVNINCLWNRNEAYYANSDWRGKLVKDGGCLFTQFSHFVDVMYYLFGDVDCHFGRVQNFGHKGLVEFEDCGTFLMHTRSGTLISFNFSTCSYGRNLEGSITVIGEKGSVRIGGEYLNTIDYQNLAGYTIPHLNGSKRPNDYGSYQGSMSNHDQVIRNVIETLNGREVAKTNGYEGMKVVEIIENMYNSCASLDMPEPAVVAMKSAKR